MTKQTLDALCKQRKALITKQDNLLDRQGDIRTKYQVDMEKTEKVEEQLGEEIDMIEEKIENLAESLGVCINFD